MQKRIWLAAGGFIILLVIAAVILSHTQKSAPENTSQEINSITLQNGKSGSPSPLTLSSTQGREVKFRVSTDENGQVHFHSGENELHQDVKKDQVNEFSENFPVAGAYTIEFHPEASSATSVSEDAEAPGTPLGTIEISPR